jgi:hypothetical protein
MERKKPKTVSPRIYRIDKMIASGRCPNSKKLAETYENGKFLGVFDGFKGNSGKVHFLTTYTKYAMIDLKKPSKRQFKSWHSQFRDVIFYRKVF